MEVGKEMTQTTRSTLISNNLMLISIIRYSSQELSFWGPDLPLVCWSESLFILRHDAFSPDWTALVFHGEKNRSKLLMCHKDFFSPILNLIAVIPLLELIADWRDINHTWVEVGKGIWTGVCSLLISCTSFTFCQSQMGNVYLFSSVRSVLFSQVSCDEFNGRWPK